MKKKILIFCALVLTFAISLFSFDLIKTNADSESGLTVSAGINTPYNFGVVDLDSGFDLKFKAHLESIGNNATLNLVFTNVDNDAYSFKLTIWQNNASTNDVPTNLFIKTNGVEVGYENIGWMSYFVDNSNYNYHVAYDSNQSILIEKKDGQLAAIENAIEELNAFFTVAPSQRYFVGFTSNVDGLCFTVKNLNNNIFVSDAILYSNLLEQYSSVYDLSFYPRQVEYSKLDSTMQSYYLNELRNKINQLESEKQYDKGLSDGSSETSNNIVSIIASKYAELLESSEFVEWSEKHDFIGRTYEDFISLGYEEAFTYYYFVLDRYLTSYRFEYGYDTGYEEGYNIANNELTNNLRLELNQSYSQIINTIIGDNMEEFDTETEFIIKTYDEFILIEDYGDAYEYYETFHDLYYEWLHYKDCTNEIHEELLNRYEKLIETDSFRLWAQETDFREYDPEYFYEELTLEDAFDYYNDLSSRYNEYLANSNTHDELLNKYVELIETDSFRLWAQETDFCEYSPEFFREILTLVNAFDYYNEVSTRYHQDIAKKAGYNDGIDVGYAEGYDTAVNDYLADFNPYFSKTNMSANFMALIQDGTECWVRNFDVFSNEINHGYDLKNLYRFIHTLNNNIVKPSDIDNTILPENDLWDLRNCYLYLDFNSYIPFGNFNFNFTGADQITFYLSDGTTKIFNPDGYNGELSYFNISGLENDGDNILKIKQIVVQFNFSRCESIHNKNDFETVTYAAMTSEKNNSEYIKGYQSGLDVGSTEAQVTINKLKEEHAKELLEKYDKGFYAGKDFGYNKGYKEGLAETEGYTLGYNDGYAVGIEENKPLTFWEKISNFFNKLFDAIGNAFS